MQSVAVVPIFVSVGSAVMPTVAAALASVLAVAFKPRELWRLVRRRPGVALGVAAGFLIVVALSVLLVHSRSAVRSARPVEARAPRLPLGGFQYPFLRSGGPRREFRPLRRRRYPRYLNLTSGRQQGEFGL